MPSPWRCYLSWPPGHRWQLVTEDRQTFQRCERCAKRRVGTFSADHKTSHHFGGHE